MFDHLPTWYAYPTLLGLAAALPVMALVWLYARRRKRIAAAQLGHAVVLHRLESGSWSWLWRVPCLVLGLVLLIVGAAGPRWGRMSSAGIQNRQPALVLVMDVSRSMLAEQPSRQERARRALRDLANTLTAQGGPRIALVIFAAHAQLAFPLTGDYDHLLDALTRVDADDLPPALRPRGAGDSASGTRIGEALRLALHALDPKTGGDILLLSDGDDPGGDDEWLEGADEARRHHVPVYVLGIGDPARASTIPWGSGVVEFGGAAVLTRLQEKPLQEIARRTGGTYIPARTEDLPLGKLLPGLLAGRPDEGEVDPETTLPVLQPRYAWFLMPAFLLLGLTLVGKERARARPENALPADAPRYLAVLRLVFVPFLLILVSAAPSPDAEQLLREGADAFERGQMKEALRCFDEAELETNDPALVSFNKAGALYRLERYGEAALHYQMCLEDRAIPAGRRSLAYFQMGNALLRESRGAARMVLEKAIDAYRAGLLLDDTPPSVRADAKNNLELARLFWLKILPNPEDPGSAPEPPPMKSPKSSDVDKKGRKNGDGAAKTEKHGSADYADGGGKEGGAKSDKAASGPLTVLPDQSELVPLSPQETEAHLREHTRRIHDERRQFRRQTAAAPEHVKDW